MEKSNGPVNAASWLGLKDGESDTVDEELVMDLFKTYRFGKDNVPAREFRFKSADTVTAPEPFNTTDIEVEVEEDDDGSRDTIIHEPTVSETGSNEDLGSNEESGSNVETASNEDPGSNKESGSNEESVSNEENGLNCLESSSINLANVENERQQQNRESGEIDGQEDSEEKSKEKSHLEKLLATQENYELYCPSCSSCITRKVILKKRTRGKHADLSTDLELNVPVHEPDEPSDIEEMEPPLKVHLLPETLIEDDVQEDKDKGTIFTCLACLKYFIRLGTRFFQLDYITGKPVEEPVEVNLERKNSINTSLSPSQIQPDRERFIVELLKSTVYGGLTETITSLGVVSSASASGSSTVNILALAVANLAGGLIFLAQNLQDLRNSSDRYEELLGRRANFQMHILVTVLSYIFFGLIPPLIYAFSFYETGIKNYKLVSVFLVSLVCVIMLGLIKVYVRKPTSSGESPKSYLKSAAYYTFIVVASSGISYVVGDIMGEYIGKLSWVGLDQVSITSPFDGI